MKKLTVGNDGKDQGSDAHGQRTENEKRANGFEKTTRLIIEQRQISKSPRIFSREDRMMLPSILSSRFSLLLLLKFDQIDRRWSRRKMIVRRWS